MDYILEHKFDEENNHWIATISGEVDIFNSEQMKESLLELISEKQTDLKIDCKYLEYIDSTALGALVGVLKNVKAYNGGVYLLNVRPSLAKLFKITNLDRVFIIEGDVNEK